MHMLLHDTIYICAHIHVYIHIDITFVCISFFVYLHLGCFSLFLFNKGKPCYSTCTLLTFGSLAALRRSVRHLCHLSATLAKPCWPQGDTVRDVPRGVALHMLSLVKKPLFRSVFFREHGKCPCTKWLKAMSFPLLNETWKNHLRVLLFARNSLKRV